MIAHQIRPRPLSREKPVRDPKYRAFLKRQPCEMCGFRRKVEVAHTGRKGKGLGLKACDLDAIPLCAACHRSNQESYHAIGNERLWRALHGVDLPAVRERLRAKFLRGRAA